MANRALVSWSSGKDSAWTLHVLRHEPSFEIAGLLTTFNEVFDRVAMHAVRRELVDAQARAAGLPLWPVSLPWPCSNEIYERQMRSALESAREQGVTHVAFGDLFLEDVREYRVRLLAGSGVEPLFPIWRPPESTPALAREMLASGMRATITCVDPKQIDAGFVGREYDASLLTELPAEADPCGERGEFHTFCYAGPMFHSPIRVRSGETIERDGFRFAELYLGGSA